jgi:hypothetical protein
MVIRACRQPIVMRGLAEGIIPPPKGHSYRHLSIRNAVGAVLRTEQFGGDEYVVAPVIALVGDIAIWPVNAPEPEFVPLEVLELAPAGWNGRPVCAGHPAGADGPVSANSPRVLESSAFGTVFNAQVRHGRLEVESWMNPSRAQAVGPDATGVLERVAAAVPVEVSVGCFITLVEDPGVDRNGRAYRYKWASIVQDHLAMLKEGDTGACSVEMGCGSPRTASAHRHRVHIVTAAGMSIEERDMTVAATQPGAPAPAPTPVPHSPAPAPAPTPAPSAPTSAPAPATPPAPRSLKDRFMEKLKFITKPRTAVAGLSDEDLRMRISDALRAVEPGFQGIDMVFPDDMQVIYWCAPADAWLTLRRSFTADAAGVIALNDDREEVVPVVTFEPVSPTTAAAAPTPAATGAAPTAAAGCGCQHPAPATANTGDNPMQFTDAQKAARAPRIKALIDNPRCQFAAADQSYLETLADDRLQALEDGSKDTTGNPAPNAPAPGAPNTGGADNAPHPTTDHVGAPAPGTVPAAPGTPAPAPAAPAAPGSTTPSTSAAAPAAAAAKPLTSAEWMAQAPPEIRGLVERQQAADTARKTTLIGQLKTAQAEYTEAELQAMDVPALERVARLAKVDAPAADFSGIGLPRASAAAGDTGAPAPIDMVSRIAAKAKEQQKAS